jgi:hypothetical protein
VTWLRDASVAGRGGRSAWWNGKVVKMLNSADMPGKTVAEKLLIKSGRRVYLIDAPSGYTERLQAECPDASISEKKITTPDMIQIFVSSGAELKKKLPSAKRLLSPGTALWVSYPKGTSKAHADVNRDTIRKYAETIGLATVSLIAIDDIWSALRLKPV